MKITAQQLRRIIKEEVRRVLNEGTMPDGPATLMPGATYASKVGVRRPISGEFELRPGIDDEGNPVAGEFFFGPNERMISGYDQLWVSQEDIDNGLIVPA